MNPNALDRALLDRYLTGECSAAEAEAVREWLAANPANSARLQELRDVREVMGSRATWDVAGLWQRTREEIARAEPDGVFARRDEPAGHIGVAVGVGEEASRASRASRRLDSARHVPKFTLTRWPIRTRVWKVAAAVAALVGAGTLWHGTRPDVSAPAGSHVATMHDYTTARGQIAELKLPDGTAVLLSVASRLRVPNDFSRSRTVYLEGEARFTVPPRGGQPFFVHAGGLVTRDLSTEFVVRAYPGEAAARVIVSEGSVAVRDMVPARAPAAVLDAGDVLTRAVNQTLAIERGVDVAPYLAWTRHELVFRGVPIGEVLKELSRWYDLRFEIADSSVAARKTSATLAANGVTRDVLALLAVSADMHVEYRGRIAVFSNAREHRPAGHEPNAGTD